MDKPQNTIFRIPAPLIEKFHNLGYRQKIMVAFLCISLIPLILLGSFCFIETKSLLSRQAENNLEASLRQASLSVNSQLEAYNQVSSALCFDSSLTMASNMDYDSYYAMFEQLTYTIDDKFVTARNLKSGVEGITLYTGSNLPKHGKTVAPIAEARNQPWYPLRQDSISTLWYREEDTLLCIQPILNTHVSNPKENLLVTRVTAESVFNAASALTFQNIGVLITDHSQNTIFESCPFPEAPAARDLLTGRLAAASDKEQEPILFHARLGKTSYTLMSVSLPAAGWDMLIYMPDSLFGRPAVLISLTVCIMIFFCFLLVYLSSRVFSRRIVYRIEALRENMKTVAQGRLEVTVTSDSQDEIGEMTKDFGKMVEKIDKLIQENYASELKSKQSEMKALQAQINPHFLYNSLSLINWRALRIHATDISEMAQLLSSFYRTCLNKGKNLITVADELLNVRSYTKIQLIMHSDSFDVKYHVDETLSGCHMPNLMLQPLVENAIVHGIENKEDGRGRITIICEREESDIIFRVEDNGVGIAEAAVFSLLSQDSKGYGLKNVHERAQILYGDSYGLTIESSIGKGTKISLRLPSGISNPM